MFKTMKTTLLLLTLLLGVKTTFAMHHQHNLDHDQNAKLTINEPWVRSAPANAPMLGAFMQIHNHSNNDMKLISAHAKGYQRVELHRTMEHHGVMRMIKQDFMPIAANNQLNLKPGSWHIMLIGPDAVPSNGDSVVLTLQFDNGTNKTVRALVKKGEKMQHHHNKHMGHH